MYKCRLQEICQQRRWPLPIYAAMKDGPGHIPRFKATVSVNGVLFNSRESCTTCREARNDAAKRAVLHFSPPSPRDDSSISVAELNAEGPKVGETNLGNGVDLPNDFPLEATVAIGGSTFESPEQFTTLKEAEQAAAKSALMSLSLSQDGFQDDSGFYKNLLQEFAHCEKIAIPTYEIQIYGAAHNPTFLCNVKVGGEVFYGQTAKSKKEAERQAAKVAYCLLKERKSGKTSVLDGNVGAQNLKTSVASDMTLTPELKNEVKETSAIKQEDKLSETKVESGKENLNKIISEDTEMSAENSIQLPAVPEVEKADGIHAVPSENIPISPTGNHSPSALSVPDILELPILERSGGIISADSKMRYENSAAFPGIPHVEKSSGIEAASPNGVPDISSLAISSSDGDKTKQAKPYLLNDRVRIYPYFPGNSSFPEGITVLPVSEDKWVAVSLEFPTEDAA